MSAVPLKRLVGNLHRALESRELDVLSDSELLDRFRSSNDAAAFETIVRRHGKQVLAAGRQVLNDSADVDDVFQAAFLVLLNDAKSIRKGQSLGSWLFGVAHRLALQARLRDARRRSAEAKTPARIKGDAADLSWREACAILHEELDKLPETYRLPLLLCYFDGRTRDEAAQQLGVKADVVRGRLERGRDKLRTRLTRRGVTLSAGLLSAVANSATAVGPSASVIQATLESATTGIVSKSVCMLMQGATSSMIVGKIKLLAAVAVTVGMISTGTYLATSAAVKDGAQGPLAEKPAEAAMDKENRAVAVSDHLPERLDLLGDPLPRDAVTRLGTTRFWCGEQAHKVAFSRDGAKVLTVSLDGVFVFDAISGKQLLRIASAERPVNSISLSPDGKSLALGMESINADSTCGIQIRDLETGRVLREWEFTSNVQVQSLIYSPDGKTLASHSFGDDTVYLWDPTTGKEIRRWPVAAETTVDFTFSVDSKTLIVGEGRTIHFWDTATGKEVRHIADHPGAGVYKLVLAHDGNSLATQALAKELDQDAGGPIEVDNKVHLWDTATGKIVRQFKGVADFQFSPDSKSLATTTDEDGALRIWDVVTGKELRHRWGTSRLGDAFAFAPDGKTLASVSGNSVRLWDAATGTEAREDVSRRNGFHVLALSLDGNTLASAGSYQHVRLFDTTTGKLLHQLTPSEDYVRSLHFEADGQTLTTLDGAGKARVWNVATGQELRHGNGSEGFQHALSPDGKTWASVSQWAEPGTVTNIVLWDAATGKKRQILAGNWWNCAMAFSPNSATLYSWSHDDKKIRFWDVATGKELREFAAGEKEFFPDAGSFSPDGNWFAWAGNEQLEGMDRVLRVLRLYDMGTGDAVHRIQIPGERDALITHVFPYYSFAFSPDGHTLSVGDAEGSIHLLELASGKFRRRLAGGHQSRIGALLFSSDGQRLISGSADTTALVWDLTGPLNAKPKPLSAAELESCWAHLAGEDAEAAYQSIRRLAASPAESMPYLEKKLQPTASPDAKRVAGLIHDLDSDRFAVREQAAKDLEKLGDTAAAMCRKALAGELSAEARQRLEALIKKQEQERLSPSPQRLQVLRALEALESVGTPKARQLLQKLADGAAEAFMTREAKAALERLAKRPVTSP
jgi:RNA polymerase sigma factor (sigma-70 family)